MIVSRMKDGMLTLFSSFDCLRLSRYCARFILVENLPVRVLFASTKSDLDSAWLDLGHDSKLITDLDTSTTNLRWNVVIALLELCRIAIVTNRRQGCPQDQALVQGRRSWLQDSLW